MTTNSTMAARTAQLQIHLCVLLWGATAILGKLITLPAVPLVFWRMWLVTLVLACVPAVWRGLATMPSRLLLAYFGVGVLVAIHWLTFYASIKLANASVAASCIALATAFTAVVEPIITRRPFASHELALGILVVPGVALIVGGVDTDMRLGVLVGAFSAFVVAIFGSVNKHLVNNAGALTVTALEMAAGAVTITCCWPLLAAAFPGQMGAFLALPSGQDAILLVVLSLLCTLLPFSLSLVALRQMSAFSAQLAVNLEPVYSIVLAIIFLGEQRELSVAFYAGVVLVLAAVFVHPTLARRGALSRR